MQQFRLFSKAGPLMRSCGMTPRHRRREAEGEEAADAIVAKDNVSVSVTAVVSYC